MVEGGEERRGRARRYTHSHPAEAPMAAGAQRPPSPGGTVIAPGGGQFLRGRGCRQPSSRTRHTRRPTPRCRWSRPGERMEGCVGAAGAGMQDEVHTRPHSGRLLPLRPRLRAVRRKTVTNACGGETSPLSTPPCLGQGAIPFPPVRRKPGESLSHRPTPTYPIGRRPPRTLRGDYLPPPPPSTESFKISATSLMPISSALSRNLAASSNIVLQK